MRDNRASRRYNRRLTVRYGEKDFDKSGFTADVSSTGMFVVAQRLPAIGSRVKLQVQTPEGEIIYYECRVARHYVVPPQLRTMAKGGFGVTFLRPDQLLAEVVPKAAEAVRITFGTPDELRRVLENELRHGGLFIRTQKEFARDAEITVELVLSWTNRALAVEAKVIHVIAGDGPARGVGVSVPNAAIIRAELEKLLPTS